MMEYWALFVYKIIDIAHAFYIYVSGAAPGWVWLLFFGGVGAFMAGDLLSHKGHEPMSMKNALTWVGLSFIFVALCGGFVNYYYGTEDAMKFATAYGMEMALSVDNLFAIMAIFKGFGLDQPKVLHLQHRVLIWGVLGAIGFRMFFLATIGFVTSMTVIHFTGFNLLGISIPAGHFNWLFFGFGILLIYMGFNMLKGVIYHEEQDEEANDPTKHWVVRSLTKVMPIDPTVDHGKFFTSKGATSLFLCLMVIEAVDVVFAFDSIPVVLGVIQNNIFLVVAATISACLCLRSMYFVLSALKNALWALEPAVAILLCIIGVKMALVAMGFHPPVIIGLAAVVILLGGAVIVSIFNPKPIEETTGRGRRILVRTRKLKLADELFSN